MSDSERLQLLLDRADVERVIYDYAVGLDTKDWALWRSIYLDEVKVRFRAAGDVEFTGLGQEWIEVAAEEWVHGRRVLFTGLGATQHQMSNPRATIEGDRATCVMYVRAIHFMPGDPPGTHYTIGGYYTDQLVRTSGGWKLTHVNLNVTWELGDATMLERARVIGRELVETATATAR